MAKKDKRKLRENYEARTANTPDGRLRALAESILSGTPIAFKRRGKRKRKWYESK